MQERSIKTTKSHWDCECEANYIHTKVDKFCRICYVRSDEQPDSRVEEVMALLEEDRTNYKLVKLGTLGIGIQHVDENEPFLSYYKDDSTDSKVKDLVELFGFMRSQETLEELEELIKNL